MGETVQTCACRTCKAIVSCCHGVVFLTSRHIRHSLRFWVLLQTINPFQFMHSCVPELLWWRQLEIKQHNCRFVYFLCPFHHSLTFRPVCSPVATHPCQVQLVTLPISGFSRYLSNSTDTNIPFSMSLLLSFQRTCRWTCPGLRYGPVYTFSNLQSSTVSVA